LSCVIASVPIVVSLRTPSLAVADICLVYARPSRRIVQSLHRILSERYTVWWDKDIRAGDYRREIEYQLSVAKCVLPVWCRVSRSDSDVIDEAEFASGLGKPLIPVVIEDVSPPLGFGSLNSVELIGWEGSPVDPRIGELLTTIEGSLGTRPRRLARQPELQVAKKTLRLPLFVPSVSSHETQLRPSAAMQALVLFNTSVALVSAYDIRHESDSDVLQRSVKRIRRSGGVVFLDSGNYEAYRTRDRSWSQRTFHNVLRGASHDIAFSFDKIETASTVHGVVGDLLKSISLDQKVTPKPIIPIVHVPRSVAGPRVDLIPDVMSRVARELRPLLLAVPERELGDGLIERARTVMAIRHHLNELGFYQPVHLLGTGNPLSIAVFAAAGADSFDGLEWCRTTVDRDTGRLYHHQQYDFFNYQTALSSSSVVQAAATDRNTSLMGRMALHNVDFYFEWLTLLQDHISEGTMDRFLPVQLPKGAFDELLRKLPDLVQ
jgi:queuine/archaeosine tRNA-ribosyltransferase